MHVRLFATRHLSPLLFVLLFFLKGNVVEYAKEEIDYIQNEMEDERTGLWKTTARSSSCSCYHERYQAAPSSFRQMTNNFHVVFKTLYTLPYLKWNRAIIQQRIQTVMVECDKKLACTQATFRGNGGKREKWTIFLVECKSGSASTHAFTLQPIPSKPVFPFSKWSPSLNCFKVI